MAIKKIIVEGKEVWVDTDDFDKPYLYEGQELIPKTEWFRTKDNEPTICMVAYTTLEKDEIISLGWSIRSNTPGKNAGKGDNPIKVLGHYYAMLKAQEALGRKENLHPTHPSKIMKKSMIACGLISTFKERLKNKPPSFLTHLSMFNPNKEQLDTLLLVITTKKTKERKA